MTQSDPNTLQMLTKQSIYLLQKKKHAIVEETFFFFLNFILCFKIKIDIFCDEFEQIRKLSSSILLVQNSKHFVKELVMNE